MGISLPGHTRHNSTNRRYSRSDQIVVFRWSTIKNKMADEGKQVEKQGSLFQLLFFRQLLQLSNGANSSMDLQLKTELHIGKA